MESPLSPGKKLISCGFFLIMGSIVRESRKGSLEVSFSTIAVTKLFSIAL